MYPKGQFKTIAKHGKFMEESKVKLISQTLDTYLDFGNVFLRFERSFGVGPHMENMHNLFKRPKQKGIHSLK